MRPSEKDLLRQVEAKHLRNLHIWAWYIRGAQAMLFRLRAAQLTIEEHMANGKDKLRITSETKIYNKAFLDLILSGKDNIERFLSGDYIIGYTDHKRNKKGKLVSCRAYFARKIVKYEEI